MNKTEKGMTALMSLLKVLEREKEALLKNEGSKIEAIVKEKEIFLQELPRYDFSEVNQTELESAMQNIHELQETNLMLTNQNLAFQEVLMSALSSGMKKSGNTYSNKGQHTATNQASLLNQSL